MTTLRKVADADRAAAKAIASEGGYGRLYLCGDLWKPLADLTPTDVKAVRAVYYHPDGGLDYATDYMRHLIGEDVKALAAAQE